MLQRFCNPLSTPSRHHRPLTSGFRHFSAVQRSNSSVSRRQLVPVCRYDRRKSLNNVADRRRHGRLLDPEEFADANQSIVADRARVLRACSRGQLSLQLCMFMLTEQPLLLSLNTKQMAARVITMANVLGLSPADIGEVVARCPALLDVLPLRLRGGVEALSAALGLSTPQVLSMLATDLNLLDTPPLRVRQYLEGLSQVLQVSVELCAQLAWQCPYLLRVEAAAVQVRWISLQAVLGLNPNALQQLLAKEPRLLMPSSKALAQNHTDIISTLNISHSTLTRWICAAPMLLLVPAAQLRKRLAVIADVLRDEADDLLALLAQRASLQPHQQQQPQQQQQAGSGAVAGATAMAGAGSPQAAAAAVSSSSGVPWVSVASDALQVLAYVNKDPRVLLLSPYEVQQKLSQLSNELGLGLWVAGWLLMSHPSYLAMEPGLATTWMQDVRHLADVTQLQAKRLAACPQVFLTCSPEDVLANLHSLSHTLNLTVRGRNLDYTLNAVAAIAAEEPLLLVQHPAATAAALRHLQGLVQEQPLQQQLVEAVPELLLQGPQLVQVMQQVAAVLSISCSQLADILVKDPGFWSLLVPMHTWPCYPSWQQQQEQQGQAVASTAVSAAPAAAIPPAVQLSAAANTAAATMSALVNCGMQSPEAMQAAVVLNPSLLRLDPHGALQRVQVLQQLCSRCPDWQHELHTSLPPAQLGKALARALTWSKRLACLVAVGWASSIELSEIMQLTQREFDATFGAEYYKWRTHLAQQRMQTRGVPLQQQQQHLQRMYRTQQQLMMLQGGYQQQQQQHVEATAEQVDGFVEALQARLESSGVLVGGRDNGLFPKTAVVAEASAAANPSVEPFSAAAAQQQELQLHTRQQQIEAGDVYYDDVLVAAGTDSGTDSPSSMAGCDGDDADSSWADEAEEEFLQQQLAGLGSQRSGLPVQQLQQQQPDSRRGSHLANDVMWSVSRGEQMAAALRLSGLELYGTWRGCMVQPADAAAAGSSGVGQ